MIQCSLSMGKSCNSTKSMEKKRNLKSETKVKWNQIEKQNVYFQSKLI